MKIYPIMYTETFEITSAGAGQGVKYVRDCTGTSSSRYRRCGRHLATAGHRPVTGQQYAYDQLTVDRGDAVGSGGGVRHASMIANSMFNQSVETRLRFNFPVLYLSNINS